MEMTTSLDVNGPTCCDIHRCRRRRLTLKPTALSHLAEGVSEACRQACNPLILFLQSDSALLL